MATESRLKQPRNFTVTVLGHKFYFQDGPAVHVLAGVHNEKSLSTTCSYKLLS